MAKETKKGGDIMVQQSPEFKLKPRAGKDLFKFNLKDTFGFVPEVLYLKATSNNHFVIMAEWTEEFRNAKVKEAGDKLSNIREKMSVKGGETK